MSLRAEDHKYTKRRSASRIGAHYQTIATLSYSIGVIFFCRCPNLDPPLHLIAMTSRSRTPTQQSAPAWRQLKHCPIVRVFAGRSSSAGTHRSCHGPSSSNDRFTLVVKGAARINIFTQTLWGVLKSPAAEDSCKPDVTGGRMGSKMKLQTPRVDECSATQERVRFVADLLIQKEKTVELWLDAPQFGQIGLSQNFAFAKRPTYRDYFRSLSPSLNAGTIERC